MAIVIAVILGTCFNWLVVLALCLSNNETSAQVVARPTTDMWCFWEWWGTGRRLIIRVPREGMKIYGDATFYASDFFDRKSPIVSLIETNDSVLVAEEVGWPFICSYWHSDYDSKKNKRDRYGALVLSDEPRVLSLTLDRSAIGLGKTTVTDSAIPKYVVPWHVIWRGYVLNTIIYSVLALLLLVAAYYANFRKWLGRGQGRP